MSEISQITDYESRLVALLLGQFRDGANWLKMFNALAESGRALQDQEDVLYLLWQQRSQLALAVGWQLDQCGAVVGLPRNGLGDNDYRTRIGVWLQVLRSKGTPDELLSIVNGLVNGVIGNQSLWESPPACFSIQVVSNVHWLASPEAALNVATCVARAKPAGVQIGQIIDLVLTAFTFGAGGANGFSEEGGATRGLLCVDLAAEIGE